MTSCPMCGARADGLAYCERCGHRLAAAPQQQPGRAPAPRPLADRPTPASTASPAREGFSGRTMAFALFACGLTVVLAAIAVPYLRGGHDDRSTAVADASGSGQAAGSPATTPAESMATEQPDDGTAAAAPTSGRTEPSDAARQIGELLGREARAHMRDNVAVGFVQACNDSPGDRAQIAAFGRLRAQLVTDLQQVPDSGDPALDRLRRQLVKIWRELAVKDEEYVAWARSRPSSCPRLDQPSTSAASKQRRQAWRDSWMDIVSVHTEWGVPPAGLLVEGGAAGKGSYLLL